MNILIRFEITEDSPTSWGGYRIVAIHETLRPSLWWILKIYFRYRRYLK